MATSAYLPPTQTSSRRYPARIGGSARLDTRNLVPGAPRYELQINGGAADLAIERRELSR